MFEKVNPAHPDKVADRIAGAIVDLAYTKAENPKIAVEVLIGHGICHIIAETSETIHEYEVINIVHRIAGWDFDIRYDCFRQDAILADNQSGKIRCGDNGIFRGVPITNEQSFLSSIARKIYKNIPYDGKYILADYTLTICQSNASSDDIEKIPVRIPMSMDKTIINPLGYWTGGLDVDTGATNRKLGSDMGDAVTGGGLHGKDLSKADVSVNIYAHLKAQETEKPVELSCSIGDETVDGRPYSEIVEIAREYIKQQGGFEAFAEWGLI